MAGGANSKIDCVNRFESKMVDNERETTISYHGCMRLPRPHDRGNRDQTTGSKSVAYSNKHEDGNFDKQNSIIDSKASL
jgi:hypothetical protein